MIDPSAWWGLGTGLVLTTVGLTIRNIFLQVPFHPAGLVIAFSHGRRFWAPFGIVWAIKGALLRIGGVASYRRLMPGGLLILSGIREWETTDLAADFTKYGFVRIWEKTLKK